MNQQEQAKQADPIGEYLDIRLDMIYGDHTEQDWNELNQRATALCSEFTHEELLKYPAERQ